MLRIHTSEQADGGPGWLAGVNDRVSGTLRSVLAERFTHLAGQAPMQYLAQWRMLLASKLMEHSHAPLARIAKEVGYQTDTAFSRAFRRAYVAPPAAWRQGQIGLVATAVA